MKKLLSILTGFLFICSIAVAEEKVNIEKQLIGIVGAVSGSITSGNANQTIAEGQSITDIIGSFSSSCSYTLTANTSGLPSGLTSTFNSNQLLIGGTPNTGPGTYTYQVAIYDIPPSGQTSSLITVGGTISNYCLFNKCNILYSSFYFTC